MIIREEIISYTTLPCPDDSRLRDAVFYDIETTGLGWRSSHVYLIGALFFSEEGWILRQWFLDRPFAEKEMLQSFLDFLASLDRCVLTDYNGATFDLPYLRNKAQYYKLAVPDAFLPDSTGSHVDLLQVIRPLKSKLPLDSLRLQEVEKLLDTRRSDHSSGKDLIDEYYRFLKTGEKALQEKLFLHNSDDVRALPAVASLLRIMDFWNGSFTASVKEITEDRVLFELTLPAAFPVSFDLCGRSSSETPSGADCVSASLCTLSFRGSTADLSVPFFCGECKLFFSDYRNYYYLPGEDRAIHKSVGVFTDPAHREQAKASTCYQKVRGRFLPWVSGREIDGIHIFYREYRDKTAWIRADDLINSCPEALHKYAEGILASYF